MTPTLTDFLASLDATPFSDRLDLSTLDALSPLERQIADNLLIDRVRRADARAIVSVGELGLTRAVPHLRLLEAHPVRWVRFSVHRALALLGEPADTLVDDAARGTVLERFAAVSDLAHIAGDAAFAGLLAGLDDPEPLVRGQVLQGLTARFGIDDLRRDDAGRTLLEAPLEVLEMLLMSTLAPLWQRAAWQARTLFESLAAGATPDALGLRYLPSGPVGFRGAVVDAYFDDEVPFDVAPIAAVDGADRRWAEAFLAVQLDPARRSLRAVAAIAELDARWLRDALVASADDDGTSGPDDEAFRIAVAEACARLA